MAGRSMLQTGIKTPTDTMGLRVFDTDRRPLQASCACHRACRNERRHCSEMARKRWMRRTARLPRPIAALRNCLPSARCLSSDQWQSGDTASRSELDNRHVANPSTDIIRDYTVGNRYRQGLLPLRHLARCPDWLPESACRHPRHPVHARLRRTGPNLG